MDAVEYMDRLGLPFETMIDGSLRTVSPLSDGRRVDIGGAATRVYRLDTPEQLTLAEVLGARSVATRIGFDRPSATWRLVALTRMGVFCALRGDRWTPLRRALLRTSGNGGDAAFRVDVRSADAAASLTVFDPAGQAHLTAVGALLSLQQALARGTPAGVVLPEIDERNPTLLEDATLGAFGIELRDLSAPGSVAAKCA